MSRAILILSILVLVALGGYLLWPLIRSRVVPAIAEADLVEAQEAYRAFQNQHQLADPIPDVNLVVVKSNRILYLLSGERLIGHWRVALGRNPLEPKDSSADGRTPVGSYAICTQDTHTPYHLFLGLTYPGRHDADAALREGRIDERTHQEIYRFVTQNRLPPQDTSLGGGIGIQGGGTSRDWTDGSIAVDDNVIEILWFACPKGTPVVIYTDFADWGLSDLMPSSL